MTPSARISAAIELLDAFARPSETAMMDALLSRWARANRYAGSKDRAAIADLVYGALRGWRSAGAAFGEGGRGRMLGALRAEGLGIDAIEALFAGGRFGPAALSEDERAGLAAWRAGSAARDWPDWLTGELERSAADPAAEIAAQTVRAPTDLRVNRRRISVDAAAAQLAEEGVATGSGPVSPACLRLTGPARADRTALFASGGFEIQDAASQAVGLLAAALVADRSAPTVLDACAGGGGKTLALADALGPQARLIAHDVAPQRLADLGPRAARAGVSGEIFATEELGALAERCDLVLVDAPCSGSGAWARNPDAKWRLTPERLEALGRAQDEALDLGARAVAAGGALVYATCSLLGRENEEAAARFLARAPAFSALDLGGAWRQAGLLGAAPGGAQARFSPASTGTDGFFVAAFRRS